MKRKAIILDRDDTLIKDYLYLNDPNKIEYLEGALYALKKLRDLNFVFIIATNQSGVPRGLVQLKNLWEIHRRIKAYFSSHGLDILAFYYAPFMTNSSHYFRKPNPGMLFQAANEWNLDLENSWMIGDRLTDIEAGRRAGCQGILLGNKIEEDNHSTLEPSRFRVQNLFQMANLIEDELKNKQKIILSKKQIKPSNLIFKI